MTEFVFDFEERVRKSKEDYYLLYKDEKFTYQEFGNRVWEFANGFLERGISPGDNVAIMMKNCPEWLYIYFALREISSTAIPVNTELRGDELSYVLSNSDARAIFLDQESVEPYSDVDVDINLEVSMGGEIGTPLDDLRNGKSSRPEIEEPEDYVPHIIYTSGTTGRPKGVAGRRDPEQMLRVYGLLKDQLGWSSDDVLYTCWPLYHGNALQLSALPAFMLGATLALDEKFTASGFWDRIRHYGATEFHTLGALNKILMKQPEREDDADNPVRVVLTAGMPEDIWRDFERRFDVKVKEFYAAVDGPALFANIKDKVGSMGTPKFCEAKIVDEDGNEFGPHEVGELWARSIGGTRSFEYYKRPDATEEAHEGGWFKTGDLVYKDEDDYYYFVDRKKYTVRRKGENISTHEVERAIEKHPKVREACVYGVPSELGEDEVVAKIIPKEGKSLEPKEVADFLKGEIADFEIPKYIEIVESIPKTSTDRYKKVELSEEGVTDSMWVNPEVS